MGWVPPHPSTNMEDIRAMMNEFHPTTPWEKKFIVWPITLGEKTIFLKPVYKRTYENMYGCKATRYKENLFDILKS